MLINEIALEKQMIRDFKMATHSRLVEKVTVYCEHMKPGETNTQTWTVGVGETYTNVGILKDAVDQFNVKDYPFGSGVIGKNIYRIDYNLTNFQGKKNIKLTYPDGSIVKIDKSAPMVKLSSGYLAWALIEK
jgi:hypothetical protein